MKKRCIILIPFLFLGILWCFFIYKKYSISRPVACTMEAKICPDGSSVGRTGPECQFAQCPTVVATSPTVIENKTTTKGYLVGQVLLSPTCPVESVLQSNPTCSPKPYAALVDISGQHNFFIELHANVDGRIFVTLPSGEYTLLAHGNSLYPSCETKNVTVMPRATTTTRIMCDSGVR